MHAPVTAPVHAPAIAPVHARVFAIALAIGHSECVKRPDSFAENVMTDWSLWVLDNGLPKSPDRVEVGESVPVARWVGARFAENAENDRRTDREGWREYRS